MKNKISKNQLGLSLGIFFALLHAVWALLVAFGGAQKFIDWIMPLHFLDVIYAITEFSLTNALLLIVLAFIGGYITGWLFACIWNWIAKK